MCYRYVISGRVQGVFFRASTQQLAEQHGVSGWVKNLPDGRVETFACGPSESVQQFEQWLHHGPRLADVREVVKTPAECHAAGSFEIHRGN